MLLTPLTSRNLQQILNNLEYELDIIALTETWHTVGK